MKQQILAVVLAGTCICWSGLSAKAQTVIMPMGDSVTSRGSTPESSYRYWLYTDITDAGFNVRFVGNQNGVSDGTPAHTEFDQHYEGGGSDNDAWSTEDGIEHIGDATGRGPDIWLLDLGANDFNQDEDIRTNMAQIQANLQTIIEGFHDANPNIIILLAKPTRWVTTDKPTKQFMSKLGSAISKAAQVEKRAGVDVITVNVGGGFNPQKDTVDGTHPNIQGEQKIARKYFSKLRPILKRLQS